MPFNAINFSQNKYYAYVCGIFQLTAIQQHIKINKKFIILLTTKFSVNMHP